MVGWEPYLFNWAAPPKNSVKGITETVVISEQRARVTTHTRPLEESVLSFELTNRQRAIIKPITDAPPYYTGVTSYGNLSFTFDSFSIEFERAERVKSLVRIVSQSVIVNEALTRVKSGQTAQGRGFNENVTVTDSIVLVRNKARAWLESVTPPASYNDISFIAASYETLSREISDSVVAVKPTDIAKSITQTVTIGEAVTRLETKIRTAIETESITDSILTVLAKVREITDDPAESSDLVEQEVITEAAGHQRLLVEDEAISEDILQQTEKARTINEIELVTDRLQGWAKDIPMQAEVVIPDITNIMGTREFYVRPQEAAPPRFEYEVENIAYAPLDIPPFSQDINKVIEPIKPIVVPLSTLQSGLRVGQPDRVILRSAISCKPQGNILKIPLRHKQQPQRLTANLRLSASLAQVALEPRRIINIERKYRTLKAYLLLHMVEQLD